MKIAPLYALMLTTLLATACAPAVSSKTDTSSGTRGATIGDATDGKAIFQTNCSTCHGATGLEGGSIGPSLRHENQRMDYGAAVSWIEDPAPPMPKLYPKMLTRDEVRNVAAYVMSL